ncbi:hypothetical protein D3C71_1913160 [compost metagenome]
MRGRDCSGLPKHESDQHSANSTVAILEGMQRFELEVSNCCFDQNLPLFRLDKSEETVHPVLKLLRPHGHKMDLATHTVSQIILLCLEFTWR